MSKSAHLETPRTPSTTKEYDTPDSFQKRSRSVNWRDVILTDDFRTLAAVQPSPSEEAADNLDGPKPDMVCASILSFLMELPVSMREGLFRCLLVGNLQPNVTQLAKDAGVSRPTWYAHLHRASTKVWGVPVPPWRRLGVSVVKEPLDEKDRVRPDSRAPAQDAAVVGLAPVSAHTRAHTASTGPSCQEGQGEEEGGGTPPPGLGPNRPQGTDGAKRRGGL